MKINKLILTVILTVVLCGKAYAMPVYTDDIPQSRIDAAKRTSQITEKATARENVQEDTAYDDKQKVLVYSEKKVVVKYVSKKIPKKVWVIEPDVGSKLQFLVSEDVMKNGKIYIKKGTPVEGIVMKVIMPNILEVNVAPEVHLADFKTKNISGDTISLSGEIINKSKINFITWALVGYAFSPAKIKQDKIYTLYYN